MSSFKLKLALRSAAFGEYDEAELDALLARERQAKVEKAEVLKAKRTVAITYASHLRSKELAQQQ